MKKVFLLVAVLFLATSCKTSSEDKKDDKQGERILKTSVGHTNTILTVTKSSFWDGEIGDEIRRVFGEHQVGLPQPETLVSMTQVDPSGFQSSMRINKAIMVVQLGGEERIKVEHNRYAAPQVIVYVTAKDEERLKSVITTKSKEILAIFKAEDVKFTQNVFAKNKLDISQYQTIRDLGISLTVPNTYRTVKDSIGFLWLRQHLKSGTHGDGSNNLLVYSFPLENEETLSDNIVKIRNEIGEKHIPGDSEGMFMITEEAYTPHIFESEIAGRKAYETRGKWEVKGDFMAGPFINYMVIDKHKNRVIVFEGFTYAPSVNKRDFIFELEAIAKSMKIE